MMDPITLSLISLAPSLIKWISGNDTAEKVTSIAVDVAKKVAGVEDVGSAISALQADPKLAAEFADKIAEREADLTKAYLADIDSARKMQMAALQQDDIFSKRFVYYFALAWSGFSMLYFTFVTFGTIPASGQRMADTILGVLIGTVLTGFFGFFYGSSARSHQKDETIKQLITK